MREISLLAQGSTVADELIDRTECPRYTGEF